MNKYYSLETLIEAKQGSFCDMYDLEDFLDEIPEKNVLHITMCKDCEYSKLLRDNENEKHIFRHCRIMNAFVTDNSFCSFAEPKEIEGE